MSKYILSFCFVLGIIGISESFAQFSSSNCMSIEVLTTSTSCSDIGVCDGTANVRITDGVGPFYYAWDNGESGYDLDYVQGLCAGSHKVIVFDIGKLQGLSEITFPGKPSVVPPCGYEEQTFTITTSSEPCGLRDDCGNTIDGVMPSVCNCPLKVALSATHSSCILRKDGQVSISAGGGIPPYDILWSDGSKNWYRNVYGGVRYSAIVTDYLKNKVSIAYDSGTENGDSECSRREFDLSSELLEKLIYNLIEQLGGIITTEQLPDDDYNTICPYEIALIAKTPESVTTDEGEIAIDIRLRNNRGARADYTWVPDNGQGFDGSRVDLTNGQYLITASLTEICTNNIDISLLEKCSGPTELPSAEKSYYRLFNTPKGVIVPVNSDNVLNFVYNEEYEVDQATLVYKIYDNQGTLMAENSVNYYTHYGLNKISLNCDDNAITNTGNYLLEMIGQKNEKKYLRFSR